RVLAIAADILSDMGAYGVYPHGHILEALGTPGLIPGPYRLPAYRYRTRAVATNRAPGGAYRGVGVAVSAFVHERLIDMVAGRVGADPAEVRRRNLVSRSEMPYATVAGLTYDSGDYPAILELALSEAGVAEIDQRRRDAERRGLLLGVGLASYVETTGMGSETFARRGMVGIRGYDDARIVIGNDGSATLMISLPSAGQGLGTSFAQLLADQLALPLGSIRVAEVNTDDTADGTGTFGSRSAAAGGPLIAKTAAVMRERLRQAAARALEVSESDLEFRDGSVGVKGVHQASVSFAELVKDAPPAYFDVSERYDPSATTFSYGAHVCIVEVDPRTGEVKVVEHVIAEDCGPLINPLLADGQTHGATAQGIGAALLEAIRYSADGQPLTTTMVDYLLP
ncbi:MAG TPA: molybdopterin cofactor-binding domain-containing protein, partial [Chloroflexota bacterium]|nr:molybdopterin cofactor-binding domain-containing protein [Chloroflexota bacterium]